MEYTVTSFTSDLLKGSVSLHAELIAGSLRLSRSYLHWKYQRNPFIEEPLLFLVLHGRNVVGMRGLFGTAWILEEEGETIVLPHADDLMVHPDHRNRGLFLLLNEATAEAAHDRGFPAILSLSGGEVTQKLQEVVGWKVMGDLESLFGGPRLASAGPRTPGASSRGPVSLLPRIPGRHRLKRLARQMGFSPRVLPSNQVVDAALKRAGIPGAGPVEMSRDPRPEEMADLTNAVSDRRIRSVRNSAFFEWRLKNPHRRYRLLYRGDSELRGYMVLAWWGTDVRRVMIADYAVQNTRVLRDFLECLSRSGEMEYSLMASTLPEEHRETFQKAGFHPDPASRRDQRRRFLMLPLGSSGDGISDRLLSSDFPIEWRVSYLDTMRA